VRRGQLLDSLAVRVDRMERAQVGAGQELTRLRADAMTKLGGLESRFDQLSAQITDMTQQVDRIGRRPVRRVEPVESVPRSDTAAIAPDTLGARGEQAYNTAYLDYVQSRYELAVTGFRDFLKRFPSSENADNAQYWVGECFYSLGRYEDAEREFRQVLSVWPDGNKAPAAAYKLALTLLAQKRKPEAVSQFRKVMKNYPGTNEARLAEDRLRSLE
jgi:tol-pal system protein YbgF